MTTWIPKRKTQKQDWNQQDKHQINHRHTSCILDSWRIYLAPKGSESPTPPVLLPVDPTLSLGPALLGVWIFTQWPFNGIGSPTQWSLYCNLDITSTASCPALLGPHVGTLDHGTDGQTTDTLPALGLHNSLQSCSICACTIITGWMMLKLCDKLKLLFDIFSF